MTDQEQARERAAQELARRVAAIAGIADPLAWARSFMRDMTAAGNWRYVPPAPGITPPAPNPDAYERGAQERVKPFSEGWTTMPDGPNKVIVDATALGALLGVAHRCIGLHAQVQMDTPKAKATHALAVETMRTALTAAEEALNVEVEDNTDA